MHILYANQVRPSDLTPEQRKFLEGLKGNSPAMIVVDDNAASHCVKDFDAAQDWVTAFFDKGAEEVLGYYADEFVWEDIEFKQIITTKEELYKAFVVFNNSGPESPFGTHRFEVLRYDGGPAGHQKAVTRNSNDVPPTWTREEYQPLADQILLGSHLDYDEWGVLQWVWKAQHNADFFGIPAAGKSHTTRGITFQRYKNGKIVHCQTHWNFRDAAIQLGVIPPPDEAWRANPGLDG